MRYSNLKLVITSQFKQPGGNAVSYLIKGKPGGGKSELSRDVVRSMGGNDDNTVEFNASTRDPVDLLGTPNNRDQPFTSWVPPEEFYKLRAGRPGDATGEPCFLILEEMTDASMPMQNAICRVILDRHAGNLKLSPHLHIVGSGNRTEDKSGASRLSTKLGNRLRQHTFEENLDDWVEWAQGADIDPVLIQFIRYMPAALMDFDANRPDGINATPRSWESVSRIDPRLPTDLYFAECAGSVGQGRAAEYVAFRKVYFNLVSLEDVVMAPTTVPVPEDLSALYATVGSCAQGATVGNVDRIAQFMDRLPPAFSTMFWMDAKQKNPKLKGTKGFITWALRNENCVLN